jgi:2'-5' RNA ligase
MRLFIAARCCGKFAERLSEIQNDLKSKINSGIKWVEPENMHITFVFLGEVTESKVNDVIKSMNFISSLGKFSISIGRLGAFPSTERPRVLWIGVDNGKETLCEIARQLYENLSRNGFMLDNRFSTHITIGRVKQKIIFSPAHFMEKSGACGATDAITMQINSVDLIESVLSAKGPVYRVVHSACLL